MTSFPPIPQDGLDEVLATWVGRGSLFEALSAPLDTEDGRDWSAADVRRRANRILLRMMEPSLERWPARIGAWLDYLPASKSHARVVRSSPFAGVAWAASRRSYGWPASAFVGRESLRSADTLAVQVLRWCVERLEQVWIDNRYASTDIVYAAERQLTTAVALLGHEPLSSATAILPTRPDLLALRREGAPWGSVADVAHLLMEAERSRDFLLHQLLIPDDGIRWRLFHLAVLGTVLKSLRDAGCRIASLRPLSAQSGSPNYAILDGAGNTYSLWFEASGVWSHLNRAAPYVEATRHAGATNRNNGVDILLLEPDRHALVIECKYSQNADWVARNGYYQAMAYGVEAHSRLAGSVTAVAVGPETVVASSGFTAVSIGRVGVVPPSALPMLVNEFLAR